MASNIHSVQSSVGYGGKVIRYRPAGLGIIALLLAGLTLQCAAQVGNNQRGCMISTSTQLHTDAVGLGHGLAAAPRNAIRLRNLKWELPIAAATGLMMAELDQPVASHNQSLSRQSTASTWSNIGLGTEFGIAGLMWADGCVRNHESLRDNGFVALEAAGAAAGINEVFKIVANRQYAYGTRSTGEFWEGGKSFPSGHAAASWAFASALAHRYPHKRWLKWGAYGLATAVSLSRLPAKKHFPSDILVGSTIGYVTGAYMAGNR